MNPWPPSVSFLRFLQSGDLVGGVVIKGFPIYKNQGSNPQTHPNQLKGRALSAQRPGFVRSFGNLILVRILLMVVARHLGANDLPEIYNAFKASEKSLSQRLCFARRRHSLHGKMRYPEKGGRRQIPPKSAV